MVSTKKESKLVLSAHSDSLRIVPLHLPDEMKVAPAVPPHLTFNNGPLLSSVEVFSVFWGTDWQVAPQSDLIKSLNDFFAAILQSELMNLLKQYSVPGQAISNGKLSGTKTITTPNWAMRSLIMPFSICSNRRFPLAHCLSLHQTYFTSSTCHRESL